MSTPTGTIKTPGIDAKWEDITRHDDLIHAAADPVGWPIERVRGTIAIESEGDPQAYQSNSQGDSYGLMQVVPYTRNPQAQGWEGWHALIKRKAGLPSNASKKQVIAALQDPAINIAVGLEILEGYYQQHGTLDKASSSFFLGNPDWRGEDTTNGNSGDWYRDTLHALIAEQLLFGDVIDRLYGGKPYEISATYGQLVTWDCPGCYDYFPAYGLDTAHHWAYDVSAAAGDGAPLYAPFNGTVVCAGTDNGSGAWGTGCAAFPRYNNYGGKPAGVGAGRLELLHEDGHASLIIGHVLSSRVRPGDRVQAGDWIGQQGGMNGSHVHLEGRYANGTRISDPRVLFPGRDAGVTPAPAPKAERLPIPQPEEFETSVTVTVTADELPVLQRADVTGAVVADPLVKGDTFEAVYQVVGNDGRIYWVSTRGGRVPAEGTTAAGWVAPTARDPGTDTEAVADLIEGVRAEVDTRLREVIASLSAA